MTPLVRNLAAGVTASLIAAAIVGLIQYARRGSESPPVALSFKGWLGDQHEPAADEDLIYFLLDSQGEKVSLDLHLGHEITDDFGKIKNGPERTFSFALAASDAGPLMDLHVIVTKGDDFFFGVQSSGTGVFRGRFRVVGCAQTGTGWFSCELQGLPAESD